MSNSPAGRVPLPDGLDNTSLSSASERRKHARTKLAAATGVVLDAKGRPASVVDLSEGGVGVRSDAVIEEGATCRMQLAVPDSNQVIDALCELAWKSVSHAGFRFTVLTEKSQRQIKEWLKAAQGSNGNGCATTPPALPSNDPQALPELSVVTDEALLNLAIKARNFTNADGVAVAVSDGGGIVCRASLGTAPETGVRIQTDRGLSGECVRTGEVVVCYDAENDPRVDAAVARALSMRSAVIVPMGRHDAPAGLLEVFFSHPRAFDEAGVCALQELASSFFLAGEEAQAAPRPEAPVPSAGLPQMASFSQREASPGCVICDVCGLENNEVNRVCDRCDVPLPSALRVDLNSRESSERAAFRRQQPPAEPAKTSAPVYRKKVLLMLLAALMAAGWQARGKISADTHVPGAPPVVAKTDVAQPTPHLQEKPRELPAVQASRKEHANKTKNSAEPEVTVRTFTAKQSRSKVVTAKHNSKKPGRSETSDTIPQTSVAQQVAGGEADQAPASGEAIVLPLDDREVISAVSAPPPAPAKAKQPSLWKRLGKKMILKGGKTEPEKK